MFDLLRSISLREKSSTMLYLHDLPLILFFGDSTLVMHILLLWGKYLILYKKIIAEDFQMDTTQFQNSDEEYYYTKVNIIIIYNTD